METRASYVLVGAFVLSLIALLFGFIIWLANFEFGNTQKSYYLLFNESVSGLNIGAVVSYRGIRVGNVTNIRINPDNVEEVRVDLSIDGDVPIKTDAVASLQFQGITGLSFIEIAGGTAEAPELLSGSEVETTASGLQEVIARAPQLINELIVAIDQFNSILSNQNRAAFAETLENMATVTAALADEESGVPRLMGELTEAAIAVRGATQDIPALVEHIDTAVLDASTIFAGVEAEITPAVAAFQQATGSVTDAADLFEAFLAENRDNVREFTGTGLVELNVLIGDLRAVIGQFARIVTELERAPSRFLFGDGNEGIALD